MAQRICQRLAHGHSRIERLVDAVEPALLDAPGDRQRLAQKALGHAEKREGVPVELSVVKELRAIETSKTGDTEQALRHLELDTLRIPEKHDRSTPEKAIPVEPQPAKQLSVSRK